MNEIIGKQITNTANTDNNDDDDDSENIDMDNIQTTESNVIIQNVLSNEISTLNCDAVFVAIGHTPNTNFLQGIVEFNPNHAGYIQTKADGSTYTSVLGT